MQGITILAERQIPTDAINVALVITLIIIGGIIGAIVNIFVSVDNDMGWGAGILLGILIIFIGTSLGALIGIVADVIIPYQYETVYDVLIDNDVSMIEFLKHYEIIDQNGLIFTVREIWYAIYWCR